MGCHVAHQVNQFNRARVRADRSNRLGRYPQRLERALEIYRMVAFFQQVARKYLSDLAVGITA